ncbi:hypothetical protein GCM10009621_21970 [Corynebacterium felinum]
MLLVGVQAQVQAMVVVLMLVAQHSHTLPVETRSIIGCRIRCRTNLVATMLEEPTPPPAPAPVVAEAQVQVQVGMVLVLVAMVQVLVLVVLIARVAHTLVGGITQPALVQVQVRVRALVRVVGPIGVTVPTTTDKAQETIPVLVLVLAVLVVLVVVDQRWQAGHPWVVQAVLVVGSRRIIASVQPTGPDAQRLKEYSNKQNGIKTSSTF